MSNAVDLDLPAKKLISQTQSLCCSGKDRLSSLAFALCMGLPLPTLGIYARADTVA